MILQDSPRSPNQEPIFSPLQSGIGNVNATVVVYPSFYQIRFVLQYIGGEEPIIQDNLLLPIGFELVEMKSSDSDLRITATITELTNQSLLSLNFSRFLLPSEILVISIIGNVNIEISPVFTGLPIWWNFSRPVGIEDTKILLFPGIEFAGSNPHPNRIRSTINGFLELWWIDIFTSGFSANLSVVITPIARNELLVYPTSIDLVIFSDRVSIEFFIANIGKSSVNTSLLLPPSIKTTKSAFVLKELEQKRIVLELTKKGASKIVDDIRIYTNRTETPIVIPVQVVFQTTSPSSNKAILALFAVLALLFMTLIGVFIYHYYSRKDDFPILVANTSGNPTHSGELTNDQLILEKLRKIRAKMGERRASILEHIYRNPGCSQQEIVANLGLSKATVSREIQKLENQGYIKKTRHGMSHQLFITDKIIRKK